MSDEKLAPDGRVDIVDELEARGDDLSMRAAKYIRLKRHMLAGREAEIRHMAREHREDMRSAVAEERRSIETGEPYGTY